MNLFIYIINKVISQYTNVMNIRLVELSSVYNTNQTITEYKFKYFRFFYDNIFIPEMIKDYHLDIFEKSQKIYHIFDKLARIYRLKKSKIYNDCDLSMVSLDINNKNTIGIYQNHFIYLFSKRDLIKSLNASLSHSPNFFSKPIKIRNPYNNLEFSNTHIYNIYKFINEGDMKISDLIHAFYNSNFDIDILLRYHEPIIRNYAIKSYVKNSTNKDLKECILDMIDEYSPYMEIDNLFPTIELISGLKKYLERYLLLQYSLYRNFNNESSSLRRDLSIFYNLNPNFGINMVKNAEICSIDNGEATFLTVEVIPEIFLRI
jgi:hypothetical protein